MIDKKIEDYIIVGDRNENDLRIKVLKYIKDGYVPLGGVSSILLLGDTKFCIFQAMIKYSI